jgi:hypothetical protein
MYYFISNECENLTYVSGAKDPGKLILNVDNIPFVPSVWRINSKSNSQNFGVRLGGLFKITWHDGFGVDGRGNKCTPESAGFGLADNVFQPYAIRSFGIRTAYNQAG